MPNVDANAPLATNADAAMWRQDHDAAIRYIEALLAERTRWAPVIEAAEAYANARQREAQATEDDAGDAFVALWDAQQRLLDATLKGGAADG